MAVDRESEVERIMRERKYKIILLIGVSAFKMGDRGLK